MEIKGIVFAGSGTPQRAATMKFFSEIFGRSPEALEGFSAEAGIFRFPDGSSFGVFEVPEADAERTIGFLVDDLDAAIAELRAADIATDEISENVLYRYVHFTAPDGKLYELVEERD